MISMRTMLDAKFNPSRETVIATLQTQTGAQIAADVFSLLAGLFLFAIVLKVSQWQEQRGQQAASHLGLSVSPTGGTLYPSLTAAGLALLLGLTGIVVTAVQNVNLDLQNQGTTFQNPGTFPSNTGTGSESKEPGSLTTETK